MTKLGDYLNDRAIKKSYISKRTGLSSQRLTELTTKPTAKLRAEEVYLIAKAIAVEPAELLEYVCGHLEVREVM